MTHIHIQTHINAVYVLAALMFRLIFLPALRHYGIVRVIVSLIILCFQLISLESHNFIIIASGFVEVCRRNSPRPSIYLTVGDYFGYKALVR